MPCIDIWDGQNERIYSSVEAPNSDKDWQEEEGVYRNINISILGDFALICRFGGKYVRDENDPTKILFRYVGNTAFLVEGPIALPKGKVDFMKRFADSIEDEVFLLELDFKAYNGPPAVNGAPFRLPDKVYSDHDAAKEGLLEISKWHHVVPDERVHKDMVSRGLPPEVCSLALQFGNNELHNSFYMLERLKRMLQVKEATTWPLPDEEDEELDASRGNKIQQNVAARQLEASTPPRADANKKRTEELELDGSRSSDSGKASKLLGKFTRSASKGFFGNGDKIPGKGSDDGEGGGFGPSVLGKVTNMLWSPGKEEGEGASKTGRGDGGATSRSVGSSPLHGGAKTTKAAKDVCQVCKVNDPLPERRKNLVPCSKCKRFYHTTCLKEEGLKEVPFRIDDPYYRAYMEKHYRSWICPECKAQGVQDDVVTAAASKLQKGAVSSPVIEVHGTQRIVRVITSKEADAVNTLSDSKNYGSDKLRTGKPPVGGAGRGPELPESELFYRSGSPTLTASSKAPSPNAQLLETLSSDRPRVGSAADQEKHLDDDIMDMVRVLRSAGIIKADQLQAMLKGDSRPSSGVSSPLPSPAKPEGGANARDSLMAALGQRFGGASPLLNRGGPVGKGANGMVPLCEHPKVAPYFRMLNEKISKDAIRTKMVQDGVDPAIIERDPQSMVSPQDNLSTGDGKGVAYKDHPKYSKYFKMFKLGLTADHVKQALQRDGLDPSVADKSPDDVVEDESASKEKGASGMVKRSEHPKYATYYKMLKMGLPIGAVKNRLIKEGLDPSLIDLDGDEMIPSEEAGASTGPAMVKRRDHPKYATYYKMLKTGLPIGAVKNRLVKDGMDPALIDVDGDEMIPAEETAGTSASNGPSMVKRSEHPKFAVYYKMLKTGLPLGAVKNRLVKDGLDPGLIDLNGDEMIPLEEAKAEGKGPEKVKRRDHPKFATYYKMLKTGLPIGAVKNRLTKDGLDPSLIDLDGDELIPLEDEKASKPDGKPRVAYKDHPKYAKYFKMKTMNMPLQLIKHALVRDGLDEAIAEKNGDDLVDEGGAAPAVKMIALKDHPKYAKYFKMKAMKMPLQLVKHALLKDGLDEAIAEKSGEEMVPEEGPLNQAPAAPPPPPEPKKPKVRRKKLYWREIPTDRVAHAEVWKDDTELKLDVNFDEFNALFVSAASPTSEAKKPKKAAEKKPVSKCMGTMPKRGKSIISDFGTVVDADHHHIDRWQACHKRSYCHCSHQVHVCRDPGAYPFSL